MDNLAPLDKRNDPPVELDSDILDYLTWITLGEVIGLSKQTELPLSSHLKLSIRLVDSYATVTKCFIRDCDMSAHAKFRMQLLRFAIQMDPRTRATVLPDLTRMKGDRRRQKNRSDAFLDTVNGFGDMERSKLGTTTGDEPQPAYMTLLDMLPEFISLSASYYRLTKSQPTVEWAEIAKWFILIASADQYAYHGALGVNPLRMSMSYGFSAAFLEEYTYDEDELAIANLFWQGEAPVESDVWTEARSAILEKMAPAEGVSVADHFKTLIAENQQSINQAFSRIWNMVEDFSAVLPLPLLLSIEIPP